MQRLCVLALLAFILIVPSVSRAENNLLRDPDFRDGFAVMAPLRDIYTDRSRFEKVFRYNEHSNAVTSAKLPPWRLVQWGSKRSLSSATVSQSSGEKQWTVAELRDGSDVVFKRVALHTPDIDNPSALMLEINALAEFSAERDELAVAGKPGNSRYLSDNDHYWPHLLMVQNLSTHHLSAYQHLHFAMDARLLFDEQNRRDGYRRELHAGRFVVSFAVRNVMTGTSFWLNVPLYDDRFPQTGFGCQKCTSDTVCHFPQALGEEGKWLCPFDGERWNTTAEKQGTQRMIFRVPTRALAAHDMQAGSWTHYEADLLPFIEAAVDAAHEQSSSIQTALEHVDITLISIGWEMTGLNHAAMEIGHLALEGK